MPSCSRKLQSAFASRPIVGYIIAGIVAGPAGLALVQPADEITLSYR